MQCNVVQCGVVQCSVVQCSAVQCSVVQCSVVQCSAVQCSAVQCSVVQSSLVQCSVVPWEFKAAGSSSGTGQQFLGNWPAVPRELAGSAWGTGEAAPWEFRAASSSSGTASSSSGTASSSLGTASLASSSLPSWELAKQLPGNLGRPAVPWELVGNSLGTGQFPKNWRSSSLGI